MATRTRPATVEHAAQVEAFDAPGDTPPEVTKAPTARQHIKDSHGVIARAQALVVSNPQEYESAATVLQELRGAYKRMEAERLSITRPMNAAIDKVMAFFKPHTAALTTAGDMVRAKLNAYDAEQARIAEEARLKAEAEAKAARDKAEREAREAREAAEAKARSEREEAERQRRAQEQAEAEARRQREAAKRAEWEAVEAKRRGDAEAARKAEQAARDAEQARLAEEARAAAAQREATKAEAKADRTEARAEARAEALEMQAASVVAPVIESAAPKVSGIARRMVWKWKVTNADEHKRAVLVLDEKKVEKLVKAMGKDAVDIVGGIEVWQENDISARAK